MKKIIEVLKLNWEGDGVFPEIWEVNVVIRWTVVYPLLAIQTPFAIGNFLWRERPKKEDYK